MEKKTHTPKDRGKKCLVFLIISTGFLCVVVVVFFLFSCLVGFGFVFRARNVMSSKMNGYCNVVARCICMNKTMHVALRRAFRWFPFTFALVYFISRCLHACAFVFSFIIVVEMFGLSFKIRKLISNFAAQITFFPI